MPTNLLAITVQSHDSLNFPDLTLTCAGIRVLPNVGIESYTGFANLAILRYLGALPQNPKNNPTVNIPKSVLPLKETDLHVGYTSLLSHICG